MWICATGERLNILVFVLQLSDWGMKDPPNDLDVWYMLEYGVWGHTGWLEHETEILTVMVYSKTWSQACEYLMQLKLNKTDNSPVCFLLSLDFSCYTHKHTQYLTWICGLLVQYVHFLAFQNKFLFQWLQIH